MTHGVYSATVFSLLLFKHCADWTFFSLLLSENQRVVQLAASCMGYKSRKLQYSERQLQISDSKVLFCMSPAMLSEF